MHAWPTALVLLGLTACAPSDATSTYELPAGWEDARHVDVFLGPASGGCSSEGTPELAADVHAGDVGVVVDALTLSCAQPHEGFVRARAGGFDLLLQPQDMHPAGLAGCVCASKLRAELGEGTAGSEVSVYSRPSFEEDPDGEPTLLGTVTAESDAPAGCDAFMPCSVDSVCTNENTQDPAEYWEECIAIDGCPTAVCVSVPEACMIECGTLDCAILESYPEQVSCNG